MCLIHFLTLWLKYNAHVPGSLDIKLHFSFHGIFSNCSWVMFFLFVNLYILCKSSNHFVSAADNDINSMGIPSWHIMAIRSFLLCSKYGGLDQIFLKIL